MSFHKNSLFQSEGPKMSPFSLGSCCYKQIIFVMTKRHRAANHGEEHCKGHGRRWDTERLRGVTPVLVLRHGGRLRATLKSTAGEPAVLFTIAQGRIWESLAVHIPNLPDTNARTLALRISPLGAFLCPSVAQVRSAPLRRGLQLDDAWS